MKLLSNFTALLVTSPGLMNLAAARISVNAVYDNRDIGQSISWMTVTDNGALVMTMPYTSFPRLNKQCRSPTPQVSGWIGQMCNDGYLSWSVGFTTAVGVRTGMFKLSRKCTTASGNSGVDHPNGCSTFVLSGSM